MPQPISSGPVPLPIVRMRLNSRVPRALDHVASRSSANRGIVQVGVGIDEHYFSRAPFGMSS